MKRLRPHEGLEIDGFTLGARLHLGGFASIWQVSHPVHPGPLVMKVPTILDGYDGPTIVGFEVEQMILPRLKGPHVPKVLGQGDFARLPYLVMEQIPGSSLLQRLNAGPLPLAETASVAAAIARALHAVHLQGVIHLDLKPGNILLRPGGEAVLIDFGLAHHAALPDLLDEEFSVPMGTYPYLAPEQFLRQRKDLRSDIFAFGVLLYEMATGKLPFGEPQTLAQVRRRLWRDPVPPRLLNQAVPPWLQEVILRALEVDPADRFQSAAQMLHDLTHTARVPLTGRAGRDKVQSLGQIWGKWRRARRIGTMGPSPPIGTQIALAPIVMVALDLSPDQETLSVAVLGAAGRMLAAAPEARVALVNVIRDSRIMIDPGTDAEGNNLHVSRLLMLRALAEAQGLPEARLTFSVLESSDPAHALIEHAARSHAGHIVMGARGHSGARRFLGSVSARVVAEAGCSVSVIRLPEAGTAISLRFTDPGS